MSKRINAVDREFERINAENENLDLSTPEGYRKGLCIVFEKFILSKFMGDDGKCDDDFEAFAEFFLRAVVTVGGMSPQERSTLWTSGDEIIALVRKAVHYLTQHPGFLESDDEDDSDE